MRTLIIALFLIVLGLLAIAYKEHLVVASPTDWRIPYLADLSSAILVGGVLSLLLRVFEPKESESTLRRLLRIHDSVDELGLKEILTESQAYNYTSLIEDSDSLSIIINDGLRWVGNNSVSLQKRVSTRGSVTEIFTVDPDCAFIKSLASKTGVTEGELTKKIRDTWKQLGDIFSASDKKGTLKIFRLKTYPTKTVFLSEHLLVETPYQTASGRANVPVYIYRKVARQYAPFWFAMHDVEHTRSESLVELKYPK